MHVKEITARKQKKFGIKQIKKLEKQQAFISIKMFQPIADPDTEWKTTNQTWIAKENRKRLAKTAKIGMPAEANQIEGEDEDEDEGEKKKNTAFIINNQTQLIDEDAFQLQENFVHLDEKNDEGNLTDKRDSTDSAHEGNEGDSANDNIQQQLLHDFDDLEDFDENEDDVQAALDF